MFAQLMHALEHNLKRGKNEKKVRPNTFIHLGDDGRIFVVFHGTTILAVRDNDYVDIMSNHCSMTTRDRHKEFFPPGWGSFQSKSQCWLAGPGLYMSDGNNRIRGLLLPFQRGYVVGWNTRPVIDLFLGARLGITQASDVLMDWLLEHGLEAEAEAIRSLRGQKYGGGYAETKRDLEMLKASEIR